MVEGQPLAPIIVTALLGREDFGWADGLRRTYFPPDRNQLRAHLTMFHHLPPSCARELCDVLRGEARAPAPAAQLAAVFSLGKGVAYRIESAGLAQVRQRIAERLDALLIPQDRSGWRAHVTVQNKVSGAEAKALLTRLSADFAPRAVALAGLAAWWYRGGPWEPIGAWAFGSGHRIEAPS